MNKTLKNDTTQSLNTLDIYGAGFSGADAGAPVGSGGAEKASMEFAIQSCPAVKDVNTLKGQGYTINTVRLPFLWEYITTSASSNKVNQDLAKDCTGRDYLRTIYNNTKALLENGQNVILDLHNYMRYNGNVVTAADVGVIWSTISAFKQGAFAKLASNYNADGSLLIFEIMNEPNGMLTQTVLDCINSGIASIRDAGINNLILIEGNNWSGLHSWTTMKDSQGNTNAEIFIPANIIDKLNNYAIAVHQYLDPSFSGSPGTYAKYCYTQSYLEAFISFALFVKWAHTNKIRVILDETGINTDDIYSTKNTTRDGYWCMYNLMQLVMKHKYKQGGGGFIGFIPWEAGNNSAASSQWTYITSDLAKLYGGKTIPNQPPALVNTPLIEAYNNTKYSLFIGRPGNDGNTNYLFSDSNLSSPVLAGYEWMARTSVYGSCPPSSPNPFQPKVEFSKTLNDLSDGFQWTSLGFWGKPWGGTYQTIGNYFMTIDSAN